MKKKILLMAAASAFIITACTSEDDILQTNQQKQVTPKEVGFEVYTPAANVTRAGLTGTMTTNRLQLTEGEGGGFGVYAFLTEDDLGTAFNPLDGSGATSYTPEAGRDPNFMFNEKVLWNNSNLGWYYNPLKYWPNETDNDSQTTPASMQSNAQSGEPLADSDRHLDRLTFFAYAPYVSAGAGTTGIVAISDANGQLDVTGTPADVVDPTIAWVATGDDDNVNPDQGVDLLWGVAPAGGLSYTAVNGTTVTVDEGKPLINMIKPDVNTSMKFLFNHALARFGITVVAAVDQVSPGGKLDPNTKITINSVKLTGPFGSNGQLNLNNGGHANVANWTKIKETTINSGSTGTGTAEVLTLNGGESETNAIAKHLRYKGEHTFNSYSAQRVVGVTTAKQDLIRPSTKWFSKLASAPTYNPGKQIYSDEGTTTLTASHTATAADVAKNYYKLSTNNYVLITASSDQVNAPAYPNVATEWYTLETKSYTADPSLGAGTKYYTFATNTYTYVASPTWDGTTYYTISATPVSVSEIINNNNAENGFTYSGTVFYEAERNYIYVVPTNNVWAQNSSLGNNPTELRTITVQIEYYITTVDSKVGNGYTQTRNVITKEVVLPSLANGKSYNLNMVLGLTSVKIEAEVDDWKVVNSQVDLPQNTAE